VDPLHLIKSTNSVAQTDANCENPRGWLRVECAHGGIFWKIVRCRRCEGCFHHRAKVRTAKILTGIEGAEWKSLLTLTSLPNTPWSRIMSKWTALVRYLRRSYGDVQYAVAKEQGSLTGMRHLHAVLVGPSWVPHAVVSRFWYSRLGAHVVDIRRVSSSRVAGYVAKYITKADTMIRKALTFSRGWVRSSFPPLLAMSNLLGEPLVRRWREAHGDGILIERWGWAGRCRCIPCLPVDRHRMAVQYKPEVAGWP